MGEGIHAGCGGNRCRQRVENAGVEQCQNGAHPVVLDAHLEMPGGIGDHRETGHFAAGSGGGRDGDDRRDGVPEGERALVVFDPTLVGQQQADRLGRVHRAAAADGQQALDTFAAIQLRRLVDVFAARVCLDLRYLVERDLPLIQAGIHAIQQACGLYPGVRHDQHMRHAEFPQVFAGALAQAGSHHDFGGE